MVSTGPQFLHIATFRSCLAGPLLWGAVKTTVDFSFNLYNGCVFECPRVLIAYQLIQQSEGHFQTGRSLIRSHRSKTVALSSYREFPFEIKREACR